MKLLGICILIAGLSICFLSGDVFGETTGKAPIRVTDFRGKQLTFQTPVKRIVCLIESALSGLFMLNEEKRVVGISRGVYNKSLFAYYGRMDDRIRDKKIPSPGNWDFVNIETVISLKTGSRNPLGTTDRIDLSPGREGNPRVWGFHPAERRCLPGNDGFREVDGKSGQGR